MRAYIRVHIATTKEGEEIRVCMLAMHSPACATHVTPLVLFLLVQLYNTLRSIPFAIPHEIPTLALSFSMTKKKKIMSRSLLSRMNCCSIFPSAVAEDGTKVDPAHAAAATEANGDEKKPKYNGWKCMPYIIGNETFERVASLGLLANFTVYLMREFRMPQVATAQLSNIYGGTANFMPLLGAFISDAYWGRFRTLAYASITSLLGMVTFTLTATVPQLRPSCSPAEEQANACPGASKTQIGVLILSLVLLAVGGGGIRPCGLPFGVDQFDTASEEGRKDLNSFFNWYYCTSTAGAVIALTVMVYIQDKLSWGIGFGIPTGLMLISIIFFFLGTRLYQFVPPEGSVFSGVARVFIASYRKRKLQLPARHDVLRQESLLYSPPTSNPRIMRLPLTLQFRCLNKAAIKCEGELKEDGSLVNPWRLCPVQAIEEVKCLIRIVPIWASGIVCFVALGQQFTFAVMQSLTMNRHIGPHIELPAAYFATIALVALAVFIPVYDRVLIPIARRFTGHESGITLLQRQGAGLLISAMSMIVAGLVEVKRRNSALAHGGLSTMSAFWLCPQLIVMGIGESFNAIGQIEFYNRQFPEQMQTLAGSLFSCTIAGANYLSAIVISVVQKNTNWLTNNDLNHGRLDYFYYVIAAMGLVNFIYFLVSSHFYRYKGVPEITDSSSQEMKEDPKVHQSV